MTLGGALLGRRRVAKWPMAEHRNGHGAVGDLLNRLAYLKGGMTICTLDCLGDVPRRQHVPPLGEETYEALSGDLRAPAPDAQRVVTGRSFHAKDGYYVM